MIFSTFEEFRKKLATDVLLRAEAADTERCPLACHALARWNKVPPGMCATWYGISETSARMFIEGFDGRRTTDPTNPFYALGVEYRADARFAGIVRRQPATDQ